MNTAIIYKKNFVPPQPGTAWVKPMTAAPLGTHTTKESVVNVAVDAETTEAPAEKNQRCDLRLRICVI